MTIPVIPGPFSFLRSAGKAVGAIGQARNQRGQQEQAEARANVETMLRLAQLGLPFARELVKSPAFAKAMEAVGMSAPGIDVPLTQPEQRAKAIKPLKGAQRQGALGVPTEAETRATEAVAGRAETAALAPDPSIALREAIIGMGFKPEEADLFAQRPALLTDALAAQRATGADKRAFSEQLLLRRGIIEGPSGEFRRAVPLAAEAGPRRYDSIEDAMKMVNALFPVFDLQANKVVGTTLDPEQARKLAVMLFEQNPEAEKLIERLALPVAETIFPVPPKDTKPVITQEDYDDLIADGMTDEEIRKQATVPSEIKKKQ